MTTRIPIYTCSLLVSAILLFASCNPNGTAYYATKWIWTKKLKSPVTMAVVANSSVEKATYGDGVLKYIDEQTDTYFTDYFYESLEDELYSDELITAEPMYPDYTLKVTCIRLEENSQRQFEHDGTFDVSECDVTVCYTLSDRNGNVIEEEEVVARESETLSEKTDDGGTVTHNLKTRSISFENLLNRAADKIVAWTKNDIAKHRKK